jgi:chromosome segregation ATPase
LRDEYEEVAQNLDKLDREHTSLKVQHEYVTEELSLLKVDSDAVTDNLKVANRVRNEKDHMSADRIKHNAQLSEHIKDKDY